MNPKKLVLFTVAIAASAAAAGTATIGCSSTTSNESATNSRSDAGNATEGGDGATEGGDGATAPPTTPGAIDPQLVGSWSLVGGGVSIITHYYDNSTWLTVVVVRGTIANSDRTMKGSYRAESGRIFYSDVLSQTSNDRGETWSDWASTPGWEEQYVLGTDEDGEYLMASEDGITEDTAKYRRSPE
ncbi:MAG: hypothetical protein KIT84_00390 [Labilithrix sp.]|nr:hypothetical protein [Labilithrix sp.]MCW5809441.1 hypothetical protein [Labilithrix sp.]